MVEQTATVVKTKEQLLAELQIALTAGDFKAVAVVSKQIAGMQAAAEKAEHDAKVAALVKVEELTKNLIGTVVTFLTGETEVNKDTLRAFTDQLHKVTGKELEVAEGVWYSRNFEDSTTTLRLMKSASKGTSGTAHEGKGKKFASTAELLKEHGDEVADETTQQTWNSLYEEAKGDGNKVYQVRQKLAKKLGIL